jgi:hypothetical protein
MTPSEPKATDLKKTAAATVNANAVATSATYKVVSPIYVGATRYDAGDEVQLTADQAKRLEGQVKAAS